MKKKLGVNYGYLRVWLVQLPGGCISPVTDRETPERMGKMPLQTGESVCFLNLGKAFKYA